jgi:hypothetical protein
MAVEDPPLEEVIAKLFAQVSEPNASQRGDSNEAAS